LDLNERGVGNLGKRKAECIEWEDDRGASCFFVHSSCAEEGLRDEEEFVGRLDLNERGVGNLGKMEAECIEWEDMRGFYIQETIVTTSVIVYES